jgi:hypothetical protein
VTGVEPVGFRHSKDLSHDGRFLHDHGLARGKRDGLWPCGHRLGSKTTLWRVRCRCSAGNRSCSVRSASAEVRRDRGWVEARVADSERLDARGDLVDCGLLGGALLPSKLCQEAALTCACTAPCRHRVEGHVQTNVVDLEWP